jgi:hypothetical protein
MRPRPAPSGLDVALIEPENPHVHYFESQYRGYVVVDLAREHMETSLRIISDRRDPRAIVFTLRRFVAESGKPARFRSDVLSSPMHRPIPPRCDRGDLARTQGWQERTLSAKAEQACSRISSGPTEARRTKGPALGTCASLPCAAYIPNKGRHKFVGPTWLYDAWGGGPLRRSSACAITACIVCGHAPLGLATN